MHLVFTYYYIFFFFSSFQICYDYMHMLGDTMEYTLRESVMLSVSKRGGGGGQLVLLDTKSKMLVWEKYVPQALGSDVGWGVYYII